MNGNERTGATREVSDWKLERFLLGELPTETMEAVRRIAESDPAVQARIDALEASNRRILDEYPPERVAGLVRARLARRGADAAGPGRRRALRLALVPAGLAAVLALVVFVLPNLPRPGHIAGPESTRIKGSSPQLGVYRKTATGSERLEDGSRAAEHDLLLLQVRTDRPLFAAILSVDGRGTITRHLPESGDEAVALEPGGPHSLDHAYELDDAPAWEAFYLVTSPSPFAIDTVTGAVRKALAVAAPGGDEPEREARPPSLELPEGLEVSRFTLLKEGRS